jgi:hypothetical protein
MTWLRSLQEAIETGAVCGDVVQEFRVIAFLGYQQPGDFRDDRLGIAGDLLHGYDRNVSPALQTRD